MNKNYYRFPSSSPRRASAHGVDGMFAWTIFIFLLMGFALFCWIGSFYIFGHPEKSGNYHLLMRLHKLEEPQRFELTEAPRGEFLKPKQLLERFGSLSQREMRKVNDRLLANFLRNYHQTHDLTPYVTEDYRILAAFPLTEKSFFYPGVCALLQSVDQPEILLEQVFPATNSKLLSKLDHASEVKKLADAQARGLQEVLGNTNAGATLAFNANTDFQKNANDIASLQEYLTPGQEIKFAKPLDLSAILHVEKLPNGHLKFTTISLLYGSYGPTNYRPLAELAAGNAEQGASGAQQRSVYRNTRAASTGATPQYTSAVELSKRSNGPALFSLAPPTHLNIEAGLPILSAKDLASAEQQYAAYCTRMGFSNQETAQPHSPFMLQIISTKPSAPVKRALLKNTPRAEKNTPAAPKASASTPPQVERALPLNTPAVLPATPAELPTAPATLPATPVKPVAKALPTTPPSAPPTPSVEEATPAIAAANQSALPPPTSFAPDPGTSASTSTLYEPGKMPRGRFITPSQFPDLAEQGLAGQRLYLQGDFSVTASGQDRSVLRYQSNPTSSLTPDRIAKMRIIVSYPPGVVPPAEGTTVAHNADHPLMITNVQKGNDGTINVYVREITK